MDGVFDDGGRQVVEREEVSHLICLRVLREIERERGREINLAGL